MKSPFNDKSFDEAVKMAHVRFGVIAPVIQGLFDEPSKTAYYKRIAEKPLKMPDGTETVFNYNTFQKWEEKYRQNGIDGLIPKTRQDAGKSRVLTDEAIEQIFLLKEQFPHINATLTYSKLIEDGFVLKTDVSLSSVQRFMKNQNLKSARPLNVKDRKAFEEEFPGNMYQADTCHSVYITEDGVMRKTYLFMIVDDHSRMIVGAQFFYQDTAYNFQLVLKDAFAKHGLCRKLYVDSGAPYRNGQLTLILDSLGVVEIHTPIRDGASKGKIERAFRTIQDTWLNGLDLSCVGSLAELNRLLADYVRMRNTSVNSSIKETPLERYSRHLDRVRLVPSLEWLDECFMNRTHRKVRKDSTISIASVSYDVPMQFIGMTVEVRFLPVDMKTAYIFFDGKRFPIRYTNKVENCRAKRNNPHAIDYSASGGNGENV